MAFDKKAYPANWGEIRLQVQVRAGDRCEGCIHYPECRAENGKPHPVTGTKVVCTVAHWPDPTKSNAALTNLLFLCQRCHLSLDREHHLAVAKFNRLKRALRREPPLPLDPGAVGVWSEAEQMALARLEEENRQIPKASVVREPPEPAKAPRQRLSR